ncbi:MAG TPA: DNA replication and repair protein RecF [Polyangiaceae bacterium]|nr:DNA replication and repair protein RecF [Polyangiaceae bacterium]
MSAGQAALARVAFQRVALQTFRNLERVVFEPAARLNVVAGDNGQGKTSLLEALYFVATTRSFRTEKHANLVQNGVTQTVVQATIVEGELAREQRTAIVAGVRRAAINGKRAERLLDYAQKTPVVAFHPGDLELVSGASRVRRRLLDRVALFVDPAGYEHRAAYEQAIKGRQRVLEERGERAVELDAYELIAAQHGARYQLARAAASQALVQALEPAFARLGTGTLRLVAAYQPGGVGETAAFAAELRARRTRDRVRRAATYGPARDELYLELERQPARTHASQGQQRILTLALKLAELDCIARARGALPVLLLDDVSSELDPTRTGAVYALLRASASQVFVTTTRPELFTTPGEHAAERVDWTMKAGVLAAV